MREETELLLMSLEDVKKLYDKHVKKLFSNKEITAPILQMVIHEYKDCTLEEIIACMDDISYQKTAVSAIKSMQIDKRDTEKTSLEEKLILYDLHFKARKPKKASGEVLVYLHFNMEFQNDYHPGYPVIKRGIYYGAREISEQLGILTKTTDYSDIEKVYSIWICSEEKMPKKLQNTMTRYYIKKEDVIGYTEEPKEDYDLMEVILIREGEEPLKEGVFDYLNSLTQADLERTKKYSDIEWSEALNEEAKRMPGFADTLIKKTEIESKAKGKVEGKAEKTVEVVRNMQKEGFSPEMIAKIVQKSVATVKSMML